MDNPEVIFLRPRHEETKREVALQCLMVEFGIDFAFSDAHELPDALPDDLAGVKAVVMDRDSAADYRRGRIGERIAAFARAGGVVFEFWGPSNFREIDENAVRGGLDMVIASADLTMHHPRLRRRRLCPGIRQGSGAGIVGPVGLPRRGRPHSCTPAGIARAARPFWCRRPTPSAE